MNKKRNFKSQIKRKPKFNGIKKKKKANQKGENLNEDIAYLRLSSKMIILEGNARIQRKNIKYMN